jgi:type VI secretion system protein ImpB
MHEQKLGLDLVVPDKLSGADGEEMAVKLNFEELSDFSPTGIAEQVPELNKILTVRNLLKDLKARVISNRDFRKELEKIVKNQEQLDQLLGELKAVAPEGDAGEGGDNG